MFNAISREVTTPKAKDRGVQLYPLNVEYDGHLLRTDADITFPTELPVRVCLPDLRSTIIGYFVNLRIEDDWIVGDVDAKRWGRDVNPTAFDGWIVNPAIEWISVEQASPYHNVPYVEVHAGRVGALVLFLKEYNPAAPK